MSSLPRGVSMKNFKTLLTVVFRPRVSSFYADTLRKGLKSLEIFILHTTEIWRSLLRKLRAERREARVESIERRFIAGFKLRFTTHVRARDIVVADLSFGEMRARVCADRRQIVFPIIPEKQTGWRSEAVCESASAWLSRNAIRGFRIARARVGLLRAIYGLIRQRPPCIKSRCSTAEVHFQRTRAPTVAKPAPFRSTLRGPSREALRAFGL